MYKTKEIEPLIRSLDADTVRRFDLLVKVSKGFSLENEKALEMDRLLLAQLQKEVPERLPAHLRATSPFAGKDAFEAIAKKLAAAFASLEKGAGNGGAATSLAVKVGIEDLTDELKARIEAVQKVQYQVPGRATPVLPKSSVPEFQKIVDDVMLGQNVMLVGGAGTGKTTLAQAVADALGRPYITINCSQWTAPTEVIGGQTIEGYQEGKMIEAWRNGWMLILDELPKLDPNTAGLFNDALAKSKVPGGKIFNAGKESFERHPDFCCIATGNVYPNAESVAYGANNKQDLSLLDRFAGSVYSIEKNPELERQIVGSATLWAWCNTVREVIEELRYEAQVSLRWMQTCRDTLLLELERFERGGAKEADLGKTLADCFKSFCRQGFTPVQQETLRERCADRGLDLPSVYALAYRQQPAWKKDGRRACLGRNEKGQAQPEGCGSLSQKSGHSRPWGTSSRKPKHLLGRASRIAMRREDVSDGLSGRGKRRSVSDPMRPARLSASEEREIAPFRMPSGAVIRDDFANLIEFRAWARRYWKEAITQEQKEYFYLSDEQVRSQALYGNTFGKGANPDEILEGIRRFSDPDLIGSMLARFETALPQEIQNAVPRRKLSYNDQGLGIFSFDRAAQGLYRLSEYYNPKTQRKVDWMNVVVEKRTVKGAAQPERYLEAYTMDELTKRGETRPDGSPLFRTSAKRVFGFFPKTKRMKAATEIFVSCGNYSDISPEQFLYSGMVALVIARLLVRGGVPVKINTVIGWRGTSSSEDYCCAVVPLKHYDEPLDDNLLAVATSDPRFWRCEGFRACMCLRRSAGMHLAGAGVVGYDLRRIFNAAPYAKGTANRFFFGRVKSEADAMKAIEEAISRILDTLNN